VNFQPVLWVYCTRGSDFDHQKQKKKNNLQDRHFDLVGTLRETGVVCWVPRVFSEQLKKNGGKNVQRTSIVNDESDKIEFPI
jgi:hypothetical protein